LGSLIYQFGEAATKLNIENLIDALNTAHAVIMRLHERHFGSFERPFALPEGVGADKVEASFKNGVLKVRLFLMDKILIWMSPQPTPVTTPKGHPDPGGAGQRQLVAIVPEGCVRGISGELHHTDGDVPEQIRDGDFVSVT
jgi:hypothetical protein